MADGMTQRHSANAAATAAAAAWDRLAAAPADQPLLLDTAEQEAIVQQLDREARRFIAPLRRGFSMVAAILLVGYLIQTAIQVPHTSVLAHRAEP
jgi:hypothetical protein